MANRSRETANLVSRQTGVAVTVSGDPVVLSVGSTAVFSGTINPSNNLPRVGIGTSSPKHETYPLHVQGNSLGSPAVKIDGTVLSTNTANWNYGQFQITREKSNTSSTKAISFLLESDYDADTNLYNNANILLRTDSAISAGNTSRGQNLGLEITAPSSIRFGVDTGEKIRITDGGHLVVGSSSTTGTSSQLLQVNSGAYIANKVGIGTTIPVYSLDVVSENSSTGVAARLRSHPTTFNAALQFTDTEGTVQYGRMDINSAKDITFTSGTVDVLTLRNPIQAGIGTTLPVRTLHIASTGVSCEQIWEQSAGKPDEKKINLVIDGGSASVPSNVTLRYLYDDTATTGDFIWKYQATHKTFQIYTGGVEQVGVNSTGTVGLNTVGGSLTVGDSFIKHNAIGLGQTTTDGRNAGVSTAQGTIIYNKSTASVQVYTGNSWKDVGQEPIEAVGGYVNEYVDSSDGKIYRAHIFTSSGSFKVLSAPPSATIDYLVVGGGGGGSAGVGGGGGAGGVINASGYPISATPGVYTISVGAGGSGGFQNNNGYMGSSTIISGIATAGGGGWSGSQNAVARNSPVSPYTGVFGSGGGGGGGTNLPTQQLAGNAGPSTYGTSNPGGTGTYLNSGGGGGGAGGAGTPGPTGKTGGDGVTYSISGISTVYAAGGGGAGSPNNTPGGAGGSGGVGGPGGPTPGPSAPAATMAGSDGRSHTGSGGGGGGGILGAPFESGPGGTGGSGVAIVRYEIGQTKQYAKATGGVISYTPATTVHTFYSSGTFTITDSSLTEVDYLVVAGGGGGGRGEGNPGGDGAGGGGAGGMRTGSGFPVSPSPGVYTITVGGGGGGSNNGSYQGSNGSDSTFSTITSTGGGGGGSDSGAGPGNPGGSGGGAAHIYPNAGATGGTGTPGQGNNGGSTPGFDRAGAGGGGAGSAGSNQSGGNGGPGGDGSLNSISGYSLYYAGGGGGGSQSAGSGGTGGLGGGGNGGTVNTIIPGKGDPNTGGGGGAGSGYGVSGVTDDYNTGAIGGSGIVIIAYPS